MKDKLNIETLPGQSDSVRGRFAVVQIYYKDYPLNFKEVTAFGPGMNSIYITKKYGNPRLGQSTMT